MNLSKFKFISISLISIIISLSGCKEDNDNVVPEDENFMETIAQTKAGQFGQNAYGINCLLSAQELSISNGDSFNIELSIDNTSENDFNQYIYIGFDLVYNKPEYDLSLYRGDYYSLTWWARTSFGRTTKFFELAANTEITESYDLTSLGWISPLSSAIQPLTSNFYDYFGAGDFKVQLFIYVDDPASSSSIPTVIYSNVLSFTIE